MSVCNETKPGWRHLEAVLEVSLRGGSLVRVWEKFFGGGAPIPRGEWDAGCRMRDAGCGLRRQKNFPRTCTSEPARRLQAPRRFGSRRGMGWGGGDGEFPFLVLTLFFLPRNLQAVNTLV